MIEEYWVIIGPDDDTDSLHALCPCGWVATFPYDPSNPDSLLEADYEASVTADRHEMGHSLD